MDLTNLDFGGDGWHIKVGQVYSNPYESYHIRITRIEMVDGDRDNALIHFITVDAADHSQVRSEDDQVHRARYMNDGIWDLEDDVEIEGEEAKTMSATPKEETKRIDVWECPWCGEDNDPRIIPDVLTCSQDVACPACGKEVNVLTSVEYTCYPSEGDETDGSPS